MERASRGDSGRGKCKTEENRSAIRDDESIAEWNIEKDI